MPIVHLLHGFVGAGKTTFAKKLEAEANAVRFSPDEWMIQFFGTNPPQDKFDDYKQRVDGWIWEYMERTVKAGADVIFDSGLWKRADRDAALERVRIWGAEPKLYALQTPFEISQERVLKRTADMPDGALFIDQDAINLFWSKFEPLQSDEDAIIVT